jgi:type II secretory ATPase GspE/PulE/Tfp pilus assembly ATPase PilB-like protein
VAILRFRKLAFYDTIFSPCSTSIAMESEMSRQIQGMILVMGVTGSGKSHFVNTVAGKSVVEEWKGIDSRKVTE